MLPVLPLADDLRVEIRPRCSVWWYGSADQLQAEGLIPDGLVWPTGREHRIWTAGNFEYWLSRHRPEGYKGPLSGWIRLDSWSLCRNLAEHCGGRDSGASARIYAAEQAIQEERFRQTSAWSHQWHARREAENDAAYQAFRSIFIPAPKKRDRKPGGANV